MADFIYLASRALKSGHTAGTEYTITTELLRADGETPEPVIKQHKSLSGNTVTVLHRIEKYLAVTTDYVLVDGTGTPDADDWTEFLNSVAAGETFTYDDGTEYTVIMDGKPTRNRNGIWFNYSFRFRFI